MKPKKDVLAEWVVQMCEFLSRSRHALRVANVTVDKLQKETISDKAAIINLQKDIVNKNTAHLKDMQSTVQTEMKSYAEVLEKSHSNSVICQDKLKNVVKSVAEEENRCRNVMVFGMTEVENQDLVANVTDMLDCIGEKPRILDCMRVGVPKQGKHRPVKITLSSSDVVQQILRKSRNLNSRECFKSVYVSPDRSPEDRAAHKQLVIEMKEKIKTEPNKYHFIRNKTIISRVKENDKNVADKACEFFGTLFN